jgi:hypothetical protein
MRAVTHALLMTFAIAMAEGIAQSQQPSVVPETPPSISLDNGSRALIQHGSFDQNASGVCSLQSPDPLPQPLAHTKADIGNSVQLAYRPLSSRCKFHLFLKQTYSPYTFASAVFQGVWTDVTGGWPQYGPGAQGLAKRVGATLADTESRRFIQTFALSTIMHQDPRYFYSNKRKHISRGWYAVTRVLVTKNDKGNSTFNSAEFLGALLASSLQNAYYPRHDRTFGDTLNRFAGALSSDAISDLLREFTPDLKRLFRKHAPREIWKIEERLPIPADQKP